MGCGGGKPEDAARSEQVEKFLKASKKQYNNEIKLLLLGTGESGKSTVAKQMRIIHDRGFSEEERKKVKLVLLANTIISMKTLVEAAAKLEIAISEPNSERATWFANIDIRPEEIHAGVLKELKPEYTRPEMVADISALWADQGIKEAFQNRNKFQLMDSCQYCFNNIARFIQSDFEASHDDLLRARERTSGIVETSFTVKDTNFKMVDVGGQRSERKKWIHCFEEVTAIIYCVALNEYDMKLWEDQTVNRMKESLELFEQICNSKWFTKTAIILFLNKYDLFQEKIKETSLTVLFPEFTGGNDEKAGQEFIQAQFISLNKNPKKKIFAHTTTATDTENVRIVFNVAREVIISQNFANLGFGSL